MRFLHSITIPALLALLSACGTARKAAEEQYPVEVSPDTLIILYDPETGREPLDAAIGELGAEIISEFDVLSGLSVRIPEKTDILKAIDFFQSVKGVKSVVRDPVYHPIQK